MYALAYILKPLLISEDRQISWRRGHRDAGVPVRPRGHAAPQTFACTALQQQTIAHRCPWRLPKLYTRPVRGPAKHGRHQESGCQAGRKQSLFVRDAGHGGWNVIALYYISITYNFNVSVHEYSTLRCATCPHFARSGGGGSSKGPAKVDKRNQEVKCPHCDKVYKQSSSLQLHIKKQHAEEAADPPQDAATSTAPAAAAADSAAAIPAAAAPKPAPKKEAVMDVGSRAGAYAFKSPKLLLQEWCAKERTPRPRYKALPGSAGRHRARVVIPHPKKSELDRLLVLPDQQAAEDEEEAQQRAAVLGLHAVAGDRALDTLLPPAYRDLWRLLGEQAARHEQKERSAAERFAKAQARQKAEAARQARGSAAGKIVMTEQHRKLVSDALGALQLDGGDEEESQDESDSDAPSAVAELAALGFQRADAARAARALGPSAPVDALLDWLCRHLPESALPKRFAPGTTRRQMFTV